MDGRLINIYVQINKSFGGVLAVVVKKVEPEELPVEGSAEFSFTDIHSQRAGQLLPRGGSAEVVWFGTLTPFIDGAT